MYCSASPRDESPSPRAGTGFGVQGLRFGGLGFRGLGEFWPSYRGSASGDEPPPDMQPKLKSLSQNNLRPEPFSQGL